MLKNNARAALCEPAPPAKSIAISVIVQPSLWIGVGLSGFVLLCLFSALVVLFGQNAGTGMMEKISVLVISLAAIFAGISLCKQRTTYRLDISGVGDIRLISLPGTREQSLANSGSSPEQGRFLAPGSLITPMLLVLRLADSYDNINTLLVFPDSVSRDAFRRLAIACRWLVVQRKRPASTVF